MQTNLRTLANHNFGVTEYREQSRDQGSWDELGNVYAREVIGIIPTGDQGTNYTELQNSLE